MTTLAALFAAVPLCAEGRWRRAAPAAGHRAHLRRHCCSQPAC
ncbi:hypothetical protein ACRAWD_21355 [Caulobacter segnis]